MISQIVKYDVYTQVKNSEFYQKAYKGDETLIRKEAVGKLIAREMLKSSTPIETQSLRWWAALKAFIKNLFSFRNTYVKAAYAIMKNDITNLELSVKNLIV